MPTTADELIGRKQAILQELRDMKEFSRSMTTYDFTVLKDTTTRLDELNRMISVLFEDIHTYNRGVRTKDEEIMTFDRGIYISLIDQVKDDLMKTEWRELIKSRRMASTRPGQPQIIHIPLPVFDGKIENWMQYKTIFDRLVHFNVVMPEETKMLYLKYTLTGEAASTLSEFTITKENYKPAYEALNKRYDALRSRMAHHYMDMIINPRTGPVFDIRQYYNHYSVAVNGLKSLRVERMDDLALFHLCYNNLDEDNQRKFDSQKSGDNISTTDDLLNFVSDLMDEEESLEEAED